MRLAYNTNGFPQHRLDDICTILGELGYDGVAITPDTFHLDPFGDGLARARELRAHLDDLNLAVAIETGARFVLDVRRKHHPTLLDDEPGCTRRSEYLRRCLDIAQAVRAETLSFWSGASREGLSPDETLDRLCRGATMLLDEARGSGVKVCFEPEPGMAIASMGQFGALVRCLARDDLWLMLDVGHVPVTETSSPAEVVRAWGPRLGGIQLDDSTGRHEHRMPGEGDIDFHALFAAACELDFAGLAAVELPRHAHDPVTAASRALAFLRALQAGT